MIRSWLGKHARDVFDGRFVRQLPHDIQRRAERKLRFLHNVVTLDDLSAIPSNRLEKLAGFGNRWSIRINDQWRITFDWADGDCWNVRIEDYH